MISLISVCVDANSSHLLGTRYGPAAIRAALSSGSGNSSAESSVEVVSYLDDLGDIAVANEIDLCDELLACGFKLTSRGLMELV